MKNKYLIDTNTLIYYFNGLIDDDNIFSIFKNSFNISVITKIEFLGWPVLSNNQELQQKAVDFISHAVIYELDELVANQTIKIRQQHKIKTPDAIIGATAMVHGFEIVTNNVQDFKNLDLKVTMIRLKEK